MGGVSESVCFDRETLDRWPLAAFHWNELQNCQQKAVKMGKMVNEEMATEPIRTEKVELSRFGEFCQRHGINPNLIMLKITLFVMYGGE